MNKTYKFPALWMMCLMLFSCLTFTACDNGDDEDTNQYKGGISLNVFGPSPVARGGVLRFLGSGMDKVTAVAIPGCDDITDIEVVSDTEIRVTVPQTAQPGLVVLKTPKGDITTKTELTFTEPIALEAFAPAEVKPGSELTITGEYLNLIKEVIFADEVTVPADEFVSQSRQEIKVIVPDSAQTGKFILSDGAEIPNWIYTEEELEVTLPSVEAPLDLVDKKPGDIIRVSGKNFDLVKKVQMPNGDEVEFTMTASSEGDELTFTLPDNVSDGEVTVLPASDVKVVVATVVVAMPSNVVAVPAINLRGGDIITLKGANMDLVTDVTVWAGPLNISWGDGGRVLVPAASFAKVTAGTVMKVYFDQKDQTWAQAQFNYGDWSGIAFSLFDTTMVPTDIYGWSFESRVMELTLTQEILDNIQAKQGDCEDQTNVGIIIQGSDLTFTKITIVN